jgi:hypothetical protein
MRSWFTHLVHVDHLTVDDLTLEGLHDDGSVPTSESRLTRGWQDFALAYRVDLDYRDDVSSRSVSLEPLSLFEAVLTHASRYTYPRHPRTAFA